MPDGQTENRKPSPSGPAGPPGGRRPASGPRAKVIIAAVLAVLCLVIFFQNLEPVKVQLLFWPVSMALIALMLVMAFVGFVIGWIVATLKKDRKPPS